MRLETISWPVYKLEDHPPSVVEGVVFYAKESKGKTVVKIIDDTNLEGETFGKRRMRLMIMAATGAIQLQKINTAIFFLGDFIKISTPGLYFIDSVGKIFTHTKNKTVPLICRRILKVVKEVGATILVVDGMEHRFKCLYPPNDIQKFVSLLKLSAHNYLLYGYSSELHKDTVRKI